jgi:hypothetical protein
MPDEKKPDEGQVTPPEGSVPNPTPTPNPGPSVEDLQKQLNEVQDQIKERDAKIADLETTRATIEARERQVKEQELRKNADADMKQRIAKINERRAYDPEGADGEMASLLSEVQSKAASDAVSKAQQVINHQTAIEKLKSGVKTANPDFDDDVVDVILDRANALAGTGKFKTAEEAVKAATDFVKQKFEGYAKKRNAIPPLPPGASAEGGGSNTPPPTPEPAKEVSPQEEIEALNEANRKRRL